MVREEIFYSPEDQGGGKEGQKDLDSIIKSEGSRIIDNLDNYSPQEHQQIAAKLIESGKGYSVASHLDKFSGLDSTIADKLIEAGNVWSLAKNLDKFKGLNHLAIADKLIAAGQGGSVADNLDKFKGLDHLAIAHKLIEARNVWSLASNLAKFSGLDSTIAAQLIKEGARKSVSLHLDAFSGLDQAIADKLIAAKEGISVSHHLDAFRGLGHLAIADKLIAAGQGGSLAKNLDKFKGLNHLAIADKLIAAGQGGSVADNLDKFSGLDHLAIADKLIAAGQGGSVADNLDKFKGLNHLTIADKLIEARQGKSVAKNLDKFKGLDHLAITDKLIDAGEGVSVANNLDKFKGLDYQVIADKLIEAGQGEYVAWNLDKFSGLDSTIADKLIAAGEGVSVANHLDAFSGLDYQVIADKLIEAGQGEYVAWNLDKFSGLDSTIADKLIAAGEGKYVAKNLDKFSGLDQAFGKRFLDQLKTDLETNFSLALAVNERFKLDKDLTKVGNIFGEFAGYDNYSLLKNLNSGELTADQRYQLETLGVKNEGQKGEQELQEALIKFQESVISAKGPDIELIRENSFLRDYFKKLIRYEESEWGEHGPESFERLLDRYDESALRELPKGYAESQVQRIDKIDRSAQESFEFTAGGLKRYQIFIEAIEAGLRANDNPKALTAVIEELENKQQELISQLEQKLEHLKQAKGRESLEMKIKALRQLDFKNQENWQEMFTVLASYGDTFKKELLTALFWWSFKFRPEEVGPAKEHLKNKNEPGLDDFSWAINFVEHITNKETLKQYFTDKRASAELKKILSVKAMSVELERAQNQPVKGTLTMKFIPQRNILTEFSGQIGDACWADKYDSILKRYPNFISLMMVTNAEDPKTRRLAGSAFLIETKSATGDDLLVIRGLNPLENIINQLSQKDFINKLIGYLRPMAEKQGRKLAIVIDGHSGGSGTNRPVLFNYLSRIKNELKKSELASDEDTKFNGYDIKKATYLIS